MTIGRWMINNTTYCTFSQTSSEGTWGGGMPQALTLLSPPQQVYRRRRSVGAPSKRHTVETTAYLLAQKRRASKLTMEGAALETGGAADYRPNFIVSLPWGPLENTILFLRVYDLAQLMQASKSLSTLDSETFWRERCFDAFGHHLSCIENLDKSALGVMLAAARYARQDESRATAQPLPASRSSQLLSKCLGASSQDHPGERPSNTLSTSRCGAKLHHIISGMRGETMVDHIIGQNCQIVCGCHHNGKCYWSSAPSAVANKNEWIEYEMAQGLAVLTALVVTPYTSFWQPRSPTYNPDEVYFELSHVEINDGEPYYRSPNYRVEGRMKPQRFVLPQPILSLGGRAKLHLVGMAQRQTLDALAGATANHYHICLSHVALQGALICTFWLDAIRDHAERKNVQPERTHVFRPIVSARFAMTSGQHEACGIPSSLVN